MCTRGGIEGDWEDGNMRDLRVGRSKLDDRITDESDYYRRKEQTGHSDSAIRI